MKCSYSYPYLKQIFNYLGENHSFGRVVLRGRGWREAASSQHSHQPNIYVSSVGQCYIPPHSVKSSVIPYPPVFSKQQTDKCPHGFKRVIFPL